MATRTDIGNATTRTIAGNELTNSNPEKVLFPKPKYTKLYIVNYYLAVSEGALRGAGGRPNMLVRFPNGIGAPSFYQKRAPESRPPWIEVVTLRFPSGRTADEVVPRGAASLAWLANLACLELHPHPVRAEGLDQPDGQRGSGRSVRPRRTGHHTRHESQAGGAGRRSTSPIPLMFHSGRWPAGLQRSGTGTGPWTITLGRWRSCSSYRPARRKKEWAMRP